MPHVVEDRATAERRGRRAEMLCVWYLRLTGWRIRAQRLRAKRGTGSGEIDIIAQRGHVVAFIEVKARKTVAAALEAVHPQQRARIARAAEAFLARLPDDPKRQVRFDVMTVSGFLPHHVADAWRPD